ncbi:MAG: methyltransferase domain-containing protein [Pseudomonadota bacterium]
MNKYLNPFNFLIFSKVQEIIGWPISPESPLELLPMSDDVFKEIEREFSVQIRDHKYEIDLDRGIANVRELVQEIDSQYTNNYFVSESGTYNKLIEVADHQGKKNKDIPHKWKIRGKNLVTRISKLQETRPDLSILDLGCGYNLYKNHLKNVTGVDPYVEEADIICRISDYEPKQKFDIIICFGPMNWYTYDHQLINMKKIKECLSKEGVCFWSHVHNYHKIFEPDAKNAHTWIAGDLEDAFKNNAFYFFDRIWKYNQYFNWTEHALKTISRQAGLKVENIDYDDCGCYRPPMWRLFAELRHDD